MDLPLQRSSAAAASCSCTVHKRARRREQQMHGALRWSTMSRRELQPPSPPSLLLLPLYLLGGEGLRPVVQDEPVFVEGFELRRRLLALLPVCDFTFLVHRRDGPPATVGGGNMVGRRHDRAFCACRGEERSEGRGGKERERETERGERGGERERARAREREIH